MNANMIGTFVLCFCVLFGQLNGSAIPMWEFLSKQEKVSKNHAMKIGNKDIYIKLMLLNQVFFKSETNFLIK